MKIISKILGTFNYILVAFSLWAVIDVILTMPDADAVWGLIGLILIICVYAVILLVELCLVSLFTFTKKIKEDKYFKYSFYATALGVVLMIIVVVSSVIIARS